MWLLFELFLLHCLRIDQDHKLVSIVLALSDYKKRKLKKLASVHPMWWLLECFVQRVLRFESVREAKVVGRPSWAPTEEDLSRAENAAARGLNKQEIATYIGIGYSTMATKYEQYPEIQERIKRGRDLAVAQVANELFQTAMGHTAGKVASMIFYLKNVGGWADRRVNEGNPDKPLWIGATHKKPTEVDDAQRLGILDEAREGGTDPDELGSPPTQ